MFTRNLIKNLARDEPYLDRLNNISYRPIFVMGQHRSGTTLLYELLRLTGAFNVLTAYHILKFDEIIANQEENKTAAARAELKQRFDSLNLTTRVIDNVAAQIDSPEEYCFILQPRTGRVSLGPKSRKDFDFMCRKLQYLQDIARPLLLKNPFDFTRFMYIKSIFPEARFLFIFRDPVQILNSQLRAQRTHWLQGNPYLGLLSPRWASMQNRPLLRKLFRWATNPDSRIQLSRRLLCLHMHQSLHLYRKRIIQLPDTDYRVLRYEDLCRQPEIEIDRVLNFLGLTHHNEVDFRSGIQMRSTSVAAAVRQCEPYLGAIYSEIMAYHGYQE